MKQLTVARVCRCRQQVPVHDEAVLLIVSCRGEGPRPLTAPAALLVTGDLTLGHQPRVTRLSHSHLYSIVRRGL